MTTIDTMFAELAADSPSDWQVVYALAALDPAPAAPALPTPDWLGAAVGRAVTFLSTHWLQQPVFPGIRSLERLGLVTLEHDDVYILAMVSSLGSRSDPAPRIDALRGDDELRETLLWRVFEVEGGGEVSLSNVDKYSPGDASWAECFRVLVADGTLPRERVLAECLRALGRDFSAYRAGFFSQLYGKLAPTPGEVATGQAALQRLLRSGLPATVAFAVRQLLVAEQSGVLDDDGFLAGCPAALTVPAKGTPIAVLGVAGRIAARRPDLTGPAAEAVAAGLEHTHRDVQSAALRLLQHLDARDLVAERVDLLEPTVARAAAEWLGAPVAVIPVQASPSVQRPLPADRSAGERAAALLAGDTDPWEVELFLATVAAGTATAELAALAKPARKVVQQRFMELRRNVAALLLGTDLDVRGHLLAGRMAEVLAVHRRKTPPGALLATPSSPDGWLDPGEFVARLAGLDRQPGRHDLVAALLSLHLDGRAEALRAARDLPGDAGVAARYALGGPPEPVGNAAVWVAAARSRAPFDDDPHLIAAGLDGAGQGRAATFEVDLVPNRHRYQDGRGAWRTVTWFEPTLMVHPSGAATAADQPTVLTKRKQGIGGSDIDASWLPWTAQIWPHDAEPFFAAEIGEVMAAAYTDVTYSTGAVLGALVTHPGRLGPMAAVALAAGLTAREPAHRALASEAFAALVPSGRLDPLVLAAAMSQLAGHATATRWSAALRDAAVPHTVAGMLARVLPTLPHDHPGLHALLSTLHEESVRAGAVLSADSLRGWLAGFTGASKSAKIAKMILAEMQP